MKRLFALLLVFAMVACLFVGCDSNGSDDNSISNAANDNNVTAKDDGGSGTSNADFKAGFVLVGDENEGYTYAHIVGIEKAMGELGLDKSANAVWKYSVPEDESCYDAIVDCIDQGCQVVFTNSYGHQSFAQQAAEEHPEVQIVSMTGDTAKRSGLPNFHNAFTKIFEARYVADVVAGMKIKELADGGKLSDSNYDADGNVKIGYVGAYPYAEVVSGYTAFFQGVKSVYEKVSMEVQYTNSWFDITGENEAAVALIADGCVIVGQHADSTGAASACEAALSAGTTVYNVGYNVDMLSAAPNAALVSPTNEWDVYYKYAIGAMLDGKEFDVNWAEGFDQDAVALTELGSSCAPGTQEAVDQAIADIKAGTVHPFDVSKFTCLGSYEEGKTTAFQIDAEGHVTAAFATDTDGDFTPDADEAVFDGYYHESYFQSAPSFSLRIDGIKELN